MGRDRVGRTGLLLRLYPPRYRRAHGDEIADVHAEMTAGLSRVARLRADADLAAHAVRLRTGLHGAAPAGRLFAVAAPLALGTAAVVHGLWLTSWYAGLVRSPAPIGLQLATTEPEYGLALLCCLIVCVGTVVALCGRWAAGAAAAVTGLLGSALLGAPAAGGDEGTAAVTALLTVAVVAACPPDRRSDPLLHATAGAMAGCAWLPVVAVDTRAFGVSTEYGAWPVLALAAAGAVLALRERSHGVREAAAVALAAPPLIAYACAAWGETWPILAALPVLALTTAVPAVHRVVRRVARARR
ncbi:hypothetical protein [Streptomyces sp. NPDC097619]|uniref:hypothetical protein n=1 Tax=Streptomyces sp. NPDC097619 TaxID=3157228 RepID=UPI00331CFEF5